MGSLDLGSIEKMVGANATLHFIFIIVADLLQCMILNAHDVTYFVSPSARIFHPRFYADDTLTISLMPLQTLLLNSKSFSTISL